MKRLWFSLWHGLFGHPRTYVKWGSFTEGAHCTRCGTKWWLYDMYPFM